MRFSRIPVCLSLLTLALLGVAASGCNAEAPTTPSQTPADPTPTPSDEPTAPAAVASPTSPILGIDVSHHSGEVDWQKIKAAGYAFVYLKATEGEDALDSKFADHWQATASAGLPRGAYHFYVTEDDPNTQADFFISTVPADDPGDLLPVVDVEILGHGTQDAWVDNLKTFLGRLEDHFGVKPMIYTMPNFWNAEVYGKGSDTDLFNDYLLWVAEWDVDQPTIPEGWTAWTVWQDKGDQPVEGVEKEADLNRLADGLGLDSIEMLEIEIYHSDDE